VHKICISLDPANAALVAVVVISLNAIVKKVAHGAKVGGELGAAMKAGVRYGLLRIASIAHHFFDGMTIHLVRFGVVVAVAAHIRLVATRCDQAASAHVVLATNHSFACFCIFLV
jgi:hypothetical protein